MGLSEELVAVFAALFDAVSVTSIHESRMTCSVQTARKPLVL